MPTKKTARKIKNVQIISASFRQNSNSHALCQEVAKGVRAAGNKAEVIRLKDKKSVSVPAATPARSSGSA